MHDLRLVGVHDDGEHVVLVGSDGNRYRLRVDEALRAAVRRDRARLGQLQIQSSGDLRPREIQARIRAGETAEEIAESAGIPVAKARRYEGPVLAERAHVSDLARRTPFGRRDASGAAPTLEELVVQRLTARAVDPDGVQWDAWRQEDGTWNVQVEFVAGGRGRLARWGFDVGARSLTAADDEARWLSEEAPAESGPLPPRRLTSVDDGARRARERVYDVEADGGVRAGGARRSATEDLLDSLSERRGQRPPAGGEPTWRPRPGEEPARARALDPARLPQAPGASSSPVPGTGPGAPDELEVPAAHPAASHPEDLVDDRVLPPADLGDEELSEEERLAAEVVEGELLDGGVLDGGVPDGGVPDGEVLSGQVLDEQVPEETALDGTVLDGTVLDEAILTGEPVGEVAVDAPVEVPVVAPVVAPAVAAAPAVPDEVVDDAAAGMTGAEPPAVPAAPQEAPAPEDAADAGRTAAPQPAAPRPRPPRGGRGRQGGRSNAKQRPSVPSWDEIMFGAKRD
ncbi:Protein of unknown function (DUF3071) [Kineococcus xinjiangensis]|uniref:DUF3071 domain-containing protein n=1 Tax=Kineococcus xinjiangensis TaxID=512762 RepID=A0A2S6IVJ4_9ACTN|nr:septation protein SepH [Kineococcus xinjiangensis]PPK98382.1 Protein of unknown function (DUF3071) [Kineococcus xinjiangensis]